MKNNGSCLPCVMTAWLSNQWLTCVTQTDSVKKEDNRTEAVSNTTCSLTMAAFFSELLALASLKALRFELEVL